MLIIPAIDLMKGKCVRLTQGKVEESVVVSEDPVATAKLFQQKGAKLIHIVDLEGAMQGKLVNLEVVKKILAAVKIPLQLGGGIREQGTLEELLRLGIERCILGTSILLEEEEFVKEVCTRFGKRVVISIDAREGKVAMEGWQEITSVPAYRLAEEVEKLGANRIVYTDISRDGTLSGPNIEGVKEIVEKVNIPVIASGGVSSLEDIESLSKLPIEGIIIGKALYTGAVNLEEAIKRYQVG